jgi:hypothetical protein
MAQQNGFDVQLSPTNGEAEKLKGSPKPLTKFQLKKQRSLAEAAEAAAAGGMGSPGGGGLSNASSSRSRPSPKVGSRPRGASDGSAKASTPLASPRGRLDSVGSALDGTVVFNLDDGAMDIEIRDYVSKGMTGLVSIDDDEGFAL